MAREVDVLSLSTTPTGIFVGRPSLIIVVKNTVTRIGKNTMQNKYTRFLRKFPHSRRAIFKILFGIIPSHFTLHTPHFTLHTPHSTLHTSHLTP